MTYSVLKVPLNPNQPTSQYLTTQFLLAGCPSCLPTNCVRALKATCATY